ncbi:PQQ-binding-like beta-propeller repeat protein [Streptomyces sp. BE147]|uniref:outer membrane protein assembly factor BamB family protein n=1 Tax=Streptomyces sp. BE147 TaxID=3002524 RepID=UPI002E75A587|nr:PQQ-binding-like beta-propeller repeat protein [Streptomyces sp. BE147]MEE1741480.1 PQQ-binding-like beta-propeller repeat protein [Streptomyces sp. BE147]
MEALRQDDPRHLGRYTVLARFREGAAAVQYVARESADGEPVVITAARPALAAVPAFRRRFQSEARTAERLAGGWVTPPLDTRVTPDDDSGTTAEAPNALWTAAGYVPALTLAEAIGLGGPLPERAVRILGAGIAEILSRVHATGTALQGLAPETVLLAEDGPRLTAFGPLGAAASAEARGEQLSVRLGYLTPEQVEGVEAGAPSDLFVLGLLLAYAATGTTPFTDGPPEEAAGRIAHAEPELDSVPDALRELIAGCLAKDPALRPSAGSVAAELALEGAAGLARGGWLPERLVAAVAGQEARVRALDTPLDAESAGAEGNAGAEPAGEERDAGAETNADGPRDAPVDAAPLAPGGGPDGTPEDAVPAPGAPGGAPGAGKESGGTTRDLGTVPGAARTDHPTTQLAVPRELTASSAAAPATPAAALPAAPRPSGGPVPATAPSALSPAEAPAPAPGTPYQRTPGGPAPYAPAALPGVPAPAATPMVSLPLPPPAPAPSPTASRRALLITAAAAAGGLIVGGGAVGLLGSDDSAAADDDKPAPDRRRTLPGQAPEPRWTYTHPASESSPLTTAVWRDKLLVLTSESQASAIDLRTGKRVWQRADAAKGQAALAAGADLCFVASPTEFLWLSPEDGAVKHRLRYADQFTGLPNLRMGAITGQSGSVVWFTGSTTVTVKAPKPKKGKKPGKDKQVVQAYFFAYDIVRRQELWRTAVPAGRAPGTPVYRLVAERSADLLVRQDAVTLTPAEVGAAKGKGSIRSFDQKTGKLLWVKQYGTVAPAAGVQGDEDGRLYGAVGADLQAFESDTAKPLWRLSGGTGSVYGTPVVAGPLLHTTNRTQEVGAVQRGTGRLVWRRSTEVPLGGSAPAITLSSSEKTLIAADASQVTAFSAADGRRLWKFQDIGVQDPKGAAVTAPYRTLATGRTVVVQRDRAFYAFTVA